MKQDEGSIELGSVIILLFLSAILVGYSLFGQTSMVYFKKNCSEQEEKSGADLLLKEIVASFQPLKSYEYDMENNTHLIYLKNKYSNYDLDIKDISSGYHLDFLTDTDLQDEKLKKFLFINENASEFITHRNNVGLTTDKESWKAYLKDDAWNACVSYGWLHKSQIDSFAFSVISNSHKITDPALLFPIVNEMPMMNVNMVSVEIIAPLILRPSFGVNKPEEKLETLKNRLNQGSLLLSDLSSCLDIPKDHSLFTYLGTKTAFWQIIFCYRPGMFINAVIAAIPKKNGGIQEIENYILIDRVIRYE